MAPRPSEAGPSETSRNLYVFGATSFFNDTASEMAYWIVPAFLLSLGAGPAKLGLIEGVAESVSSFAKLFSGLLTDRVRQRKPLVVFGYTVANVLKPALAVTTAWWQVLLVRFGDRLAKGVRGAPRDVMLAESVPREKIGSAFGLLQAMDSAGAIAGPLLALWLLVHLSFRGVFWTAAVPGAIAILVGNEHKGVRRLLKEKSDELVQIPMLGKVQSLNVNVAASILLYEAVRQRGA